MTSERFGNSDEWRVLKGVTIDSNDSIPPGPTGWDTDVNFDDSAWDALANGAGSLGGLGSPDGRLLTGANNTSTLGGITWKSVIDADYVYYARCVFTLTQDELDAGVRLWAGGGDRGNVSVNGTGESGDGSFIIAWGTSGGTQGLDEVDITNLCVVGENLLAFQHADDFGWDDDGEVLDASFWARVDALSTPDSGPWTGFIGA